MVQGALEIASELADVARARDWIAGLARQAGLPLQESHNLGLAVSEACTNAIKHAYSLEKGHTIELSAQIDSQQIRVVVRDFGRKIDLRTYREPDLDNPSEGGYGIHVLRGLMDEVHFNVSHDKGTELTLVKRKHRS